MCGICGELTFEAGAGVSADVARAMRDRLMHRGPDDQGLSSCRRSGRGRPRRSAGCGSSICRRAPTSRCRTRTAPSASCSTARSTTSSELRARPDRARPPFPVATRTPKSSSICTRSRAPTFVEALDGMFAIALWDERARPARARPRPRRQEAAVLLPRRPPAGVRLGDQGVLRPPGRCRVADRRRPPSPDYFLHGYVPGIRTRSIGAFDRSTRPPSRSSSRTAASPIATVLAPGVSGRSRESAAVDPAGGRASVSGSS